MKTKRQYKEPDYESLFSQYRKGKAGNLKTLLNLYRGNAYNLVMTIVLFVIKHSPVWIIPYVTANIINIASDPDKHQLSELWGYGIILAVAILQNIPFHVLHINFLSKAVRSVEAGLRSALVRKLQVLSISFHKELKSGKLQSKVLRDVEAVEFLSRQLMLSIVAALINIVAEIGIIINKSLVVTLFFVLTLPVSVFLIYLFRKRVNQTNKDFRKEIEEMSSKVSEMVEMMPVTRAHAIEDIEVQKVDDQLKKVKERGLKLDVITAIFGACNWVTYQGFQIICLIFTVIMAYNGNIPLGDIVLYQSYFTLMVNQVSNILNIYPQLAKGFESINSISEILMADDIEQNQGKQQLQDVSGEFSFEDVEFCYPTADDPVLRKFNLKVKPGECIAFVGESGAGKTTLLNMVIGFIKPSGGRVLLDGKDLKDIDLRTFRKHIAVVPQNTILFSGTIRDNITYGLPHVTEEEVQKVVHMANLGEFINKLPQGLDTSIGEHGDKLSGGQRQRIAIARALIRDPKVIVLDEATSALDSISEQQVQKAMQELVKGRTTFIVAHRLSTIRDADRIIVVKEGTCYESGTFDQLMALQGEFYKLRGLQA